MKQVLQNLKNGSIEIADIPVPALGSGEVLIRTARSLISTGTEKMLLEFGKASYLNKVRQQPEKAAQVINKMKTDGVAATLEAVEGKLTTPLPLGYCNVGRVIAIGDEVSNFQLGDRVISNGNHAEVVAVPQNLVAKVPEGVSDDNAVFTVLSAIALQGVRLVSPTIGENVVVIGAGLVGLLTTKILRANGCRVLAVDIDDQRLKIAKELGCETVNPSSSADSVSAAMNFSRGRGADAVIIAAAAKTSNIISEAANMCRKRGRVVLVGSVGLDLKRSDFFEKELTFQVSCSYGPGRHDPRYEEKGLDYPVEFVRWTEQRNFEAVLDLMSMGMINAERFISHRFPITSGADAFKLMLEDDHHLGIVLEYAPDGIVSGQSVPLPTQRERQRREACDDVPSLGIIGAGNYAGAKLLPSFKRAGVSMEIIISRKGVSGHHLSQKFGISENATDPELLFQNNELNAAVVATHHNSHAKYVLRSLDAGKHVFVEKPLCVSMDEHSKIASKLASLGARAPVLMVGFNRRFSPLAVKMKSLLDNLEMPKSFIMTVNAGNIPGDHWTQDPEVGGGRIVGEVCHFVDFIRYLAGSSIISTNKVTMRHGASDTLTAQLEFECGSIGTIHYFANGHKSIPKERLEVFVNGRILQLNNFRELHGYGWPHFHKMKLWRQDKGQNQCVAAFVNSMRGGPAPIPIKELLETSKATLELAR